MKINSVLKCGFCFAILGCLFLTGVAGFRLAIYLFENLSSLLDTYGIVLTCFGSLVSVAIVCFIFGIFFGLLDMLLTEKVEVKEVE